MVRYAVLSAVIAAAIALCAYRYKGGVKQVYEAPVEIAEVIATKFGFHNPRSQSDQVS